MREGSISNRAEPQLPFAVWIELANRAPALWRTFSAVLDRVGPAPGLLRTMGRKRRVRRDGKPAGLIWLLYCSCHISFLWEAGLREIILCSVPMNFAASDLRISALPRESRDMIVPMGVSSSSDISA